MSGIEGQGRRRPLSRNVERTALDHWRERHRLSVREAALVLGVGYTTVYHWCSGRTLPTLVMGFHIEEVTDGEVPAASWLGTTVGQYEKLTYERRAQRTQPVVEQALREQRVGEERSRAWEEGRKKWKPRHRMDLTLVEPGKDPVPVEPPPKVLRRRRRDARS